MTTINWILISVELVIGLLLAFIFFSDLFPFLKLNSVKYDFGEHTFELSKTSSSKLYEYLRFFGNLLLLGLVVILAIRDNISGIPKVQPQYLLFAGAILLIIPRFLFIKIPAYWVRQIKYFALIGLLFLPLFLLDSSTVQEIPEIQFLYPEFETIINYFLPTVLLAQNGIALSPEEKQMIFIALFIGFPLVVTFFTKLISFTKTQDFGIYLWSEGKWNSLHPDILRDDPRNAVLLLHGFGESKETWSYYSTERNSERITDFIEKSTNERYLDVDVIAVDFSNKLHGSYINEYRLNTDFEGLDTLHELELNVFVWELLLTLVLMKESLNTNKLQLVSHSVSGLIQRKLVQEIYTNPTLQNLGDIIGYDTNQNELVLVDRISWLAVPHFGVKGSSRLLPVISDKFLVRFILRLFFAIPSTETAFHYMGKLFIFLGLDAEVVSDITPSSRFLKELNGSKNRVTLWRNHIYKNVILLRDNINGDGAEIDFKFELKNRTSNEFKEETFEAADFIPSWKLHKDQPEEKTRGYPPVQHHLEVVDFVIS